MDNIRHVLSPLLLTSYMFGARIVEISAGEPRSWCSFSYTLLLWSIYHLLWWSTIMPHVIGITFLLQFCILFNIFIALLSVVLGIYHDKKYRTCLRKLAMVNDTLEKIGIMTDHQKLYTRVLFAVFGWFAYMICLIGGSALWQKSSFTLYSFYISFMIQYTLFVNLLDDLIFSSILGYIEMKFEQLNEYLRKLEGNNKIKRAWQHSVLLPCQARHSKSTSREYTTWIVIHLHLELCKISRLLNSIFGIQMTVKMGVSFALIALGFRELFNVIFIADYQEKKILYIAMYGISLVSNIFRLFIINYLCEKVCAKANATGDTVNYISYFIYDVVIRENISQLILQTNFAPLRFYGLGLFQFGLKFFYGFSSSVSTVIVILVQSHMST